MQWKEQVRHLVKRARREQVQECWQSPPLPSQLAISGLEAYEALVTGAGAVGPGTKAWR